NSIIVSCTPDLQREHALHSPPSSPITSTSFGNSGKHLLGHQFDYAEPDSGEASRTIIDSIYDVVYDFPQQMLSLDTPCVADIRYQNYFTQSATEPQRFSN